MKNINSTKYDATLEALEEQVSVKGKLTPSQLSSFMEIFVKKVKKDIENIKNK